MFCQYVLNVRNLHACGTLPDMKHVNAVFAVLAGVSAL